MTGRVNQLELPDVAVLADGEPVLWVWPTRTREWWPMWRDLPLHAEFTSTYWSALLDAAILHARFWVSEVRPASELPEVDIEGHN